MVLEHALCRSLITARAVSKGSSSPAAFTSFKAQLARGNDHCSLVAAKSFAH
jgi:hypothetical protein